MLYVQKTLELILVGSIAHAIATRIMIVQLEVCVTMTVIATLENPTTAVARTALALVDRFVIPVQDIVIHHHQERETIQKGGMTSQTAEHPRGGHATQTIIPNL
jgi:hypothetical protein